MKHSDTSLDNVTTGTRYELWRQDDNGGEFLIESFSSQKEAEAVRAMYEARGHKQLYWVHEQIK